MTLSDFEPSLALRHSIAGIAAALCLAACGQEATLVRPEIPGETGFDVVPLPEDLNPPQAICGFDPRQITPGGTANLVGESSVDIDGLDITQYRWELAAKPFGSRAALPGHDPTTPNLMGFAPDAIGDYSATLVVTNQVGGTSTPCATTLTVAPEQRLWIELTWAFPGDNLELMLVAPGGEPGGKLSCGGASCVDGAEWGAAGTDDNPYVLYDEVKDVGPEILALKTPAAGTYGLYVVDNPKQRRISDNEAIVQVFVDGVLTWQTAFIVADEGSVTYLADLVFPAGTVLPF